jgi:hypothetical protein
MFFCLSEAKGSKYGFLKKTTFIKNYPHVGLLIQIYL